jgi:hypothetical protein
MMNINRLAGKITKSLEERSDNGTLRSAMKVALIHWESSEAALEVAEKLAQASTEQLGKRCAVLVAEGVRARIEEKLGYLRVTRPEYSVQTAGGLSLPPDREPSDVPIFFMACPPLRELSYDDSTQSTLIRSADAHILLLPSRGVTREAASEIQKHTVEFGLRWLGIISLRTQDSTFAADSTGAGGENNKDGFHA